MVHNMVPFPEHLDKMKLYWIFEEDEAFAFIFSISFGLLGGFFIQMNVGLVMVLGILVGVFIATILRRIKSKHPQGFIKHWLYNHGIYNPQTMNAKLQLTHPELFKPHVKLSPRGFISILVG